jgi:hypothetical protein
MSDSYQFDIAPLLIEVLQRSRARRDGEKPVRDKACVIGMWLFAPKRSWPATDNGDFSGVGRSYLIFEL